MITFKTWLERIEIKPQSQQALDTIFKALKQEINNIIKADPDTKETLHSDFELYLDLFPPQESLNYLTMIVQLDPELEEPLRTNKCLYNQERDGISLNFTPNPQDPTRQSLKYLYNILIHEFSHKLQTKERNIHEPGKHSYKFINKEQNRDQFRKQWLKDGEELEAELQAFKTFYKKHKNKKSLIQKGLKQALEDSLIKNPPSLTTLKNKNYLLKTLNKMGIPFKSWEPTPEFNE